MRNAGGSRIGPVMANGARMGTDQSAGSGKTAGVASVGVNTGSQQSVTGVTSASLNANSGASSLRKKASSSGTGTSSCI